MPYWSQSLNSKFEEKTLRSRYFLTWNFLYRASSGVDILLMFLSDLVRGALAVSRCSPALPNLRQSRSSYLYGPGRRCGNT
jgi:hypothetical protein